MKIALITNFIPPYRLSLYHSLKSLVQQLRIYISIPMEPNRAWAANWKDLDVVILKNIMLPFLWRHPKGFTEKLYLHFPLNIIPELITYQPDVIISVEMGFRTIQTLFYKLVFRRSKVVLWAAISVYTEAGRDRFRYFLRKWILSKVDAVIVNGYSGEKYIAGFGYDPHKIFRSPYTTNLELFSQKETVVDCQDRRILYVGRFEERKGLLSFLKTLQSWCIDHPLRHVDFWLVGDGPIGDTIKALKGPPNLSKNFLGNIPYAELPDIYRQTHLFVFPTYADEWGMVVTEAMACGIPVLGSIYSQAVEELVSEGINGWVLKVDYEKETYQKLDISLNTSLDNLNKMGDNARKTVQKLTPEYAAAQMLNAVNCACNSSKKGENYDN